MKKIISIICLSLICMLIFASCNAKDIESNTDNLNNDSSGNTIYDFESALQIVVGDSAADVASGDIYSSVIYKISERPSYVTAEASKAEHEIVVGNTNREITGLAIKQLNRISIPDLAFNESQLGIGRYCIYAYQGSVALVYDTEEIDEKDVVKLSEYVADIFIDKYVTPNDSLILKDGVVEKGYIDFFEFYSQQDEHLRNSEWDSFEQMNGAKVTEAMKNLYQLYKKDVISWIANLYEPYVCTCEGECKGPSATCGGGAFYYSNSARNTEGYLPDLESTGQILTFINSSGLLNGTGGDSYGDILPETIKQQLVRFVKSLQDEDGYFYHPQWGKGISLSRLGRDLGNATNVLIELGASPTYNTPNGKDGDGILSDGTKLENSVSAASALCLPLKNNKSVAVSKVVPAAAVASHLQDKASFEKYLSEQDIKKNSYGVGNTISAQTSQILTRDEQLKAAGADYSLMDILINWFNDNQNPDTGTWDWGTASSVYFANDGFMKISCVYVAAGAPIPHYDLAFKNAVNALLSDEAPEHVCNIYNIWYSLDNIRNSIIAGDRINGREEYNKFLDSIWEDIPKLIQCTADKLSIFAKQDGSFSYTPNSSASTSQGAPSAVPNTNEGDVNATVICTTGTLSHMADALCLNFVPDMFGYSDYRRFISILNELGPVIKDPPIELEYVVLDSANRGIGKYKDQSVDFNQKTSELVDKQILSVPEAIALDKFNYAFFVGSTKCDNDNALAYGKNTGTGDPFVTINPMYENQGNAYVFETDMCIISASTAKSDRNFMTFYFMNGESYWWDAGMWLVDEEPTSYGEDGIERYSIGGAQRKKLINYGEWHNVRIEIDDCTKAGGQQRIYVDNELVSKVTTASGTSNISSIRFRLGYDCPAESLVLFDNMHFGTHSSLPVDDTILKPEIEITDSEDKALDSSYRGSGAYYDKSETYADTSASYLGMLGKLSSQLNRVVLDPTGDAGYFARVTRVDSNEALEFSKKSLGDPYLYIHSNKIDGSKKVVFETDMLIASGTTTRTDKVLIESNASSGASAYWPMGFAVLYENGNYSITANNESRSLELGKWFNLRIVIDDLTDPKSQLSFYVNGELLTSYTIGSSSTGLEYMMLRFTYQTTDGRIHFDNTHFESPGKLAVGDEDQLPEFDETNFGSGAYVNKQGVIKFESNTAAMTNMGILVNQKNTHIGKPAAQGINYANVVGGSLLFSKTNSSSESQMAIVGNPLSDSFAVEADFVIEEGWSCTRDDKVVLSSWGRAADGGNDWYLPGINIYNENGDLVLKVGTDYSLKIDAGKWYNISYRVGGTAQGSAFELYINGERVYDGALSGSVSKLTNGIIFWIPYYTVTNVYFDNIYVGSLEAKEEETPEQPGDNENTPAVGDETYRGTGAYVDKAITYDDSVETMIADGKLVNVKNVTFNSSQGIASVTTKDSALIFDKLSDSNEAYLGIVGSAYGESFVYETDMMLGANWGTTRSDNNFLTGWGRALGGGNDWYVPGIYLYKDEGANPVLRAGDDYELEIIPEKWYNISFRVSLIDGKTSYDLYVNGEKVCTGLIAGAFSTSSTGVIIDFPYYTMGTLYLDNTYIGPK